VVILKPSTTYGPIQGMLRQIAWDFSWIDRTRKGKPVLVCGDGFAIHQHLHVDNIAQAFAGVIGKEHTLGQTYNAVGRGYITWADYHRLAGRILGRDVELVGVPFEDLKRLNVPGMDILVDEFAYNDYYSGEKLFRDVPEFHPQISLEQGMAQVFEITERQGRIPNSEELTWEDEIIKRQKRVTSGG
jgi:nucleoside-diphosphate-sugar epimerase